MEQKIKDENIRLRNELGRLKFDRFEDIDNWYECGFEAGQLYERERILKEAEPNGTAN